MSSKLTARQSEILDMRTTDGLTVKQIADRLSISRAAVYAVLRVDKVREELIARSRSALAHASYDAVNTLIKLNKSARSELVRYHAASAILDRSGVSADSHSQGGLAIQINLEVPSQSSDGVIDASPVSGGVTQNSE